MDRRRTTQLLTALYSMDTRSPDWGPVLAVLGQIFQCSHAGVCRFADGSSAGCAAEVLETWGDGAEPSATDAANPPWLSLARDRLLRDGIAGSADPWDGTPEGAKPATAAPSGHGLALGTPSDGSSALTVLVMRRPPPAADFDEDERALACSLLPHLRNVCAWQQRFHSIDYQSEQFRAALDSLAEGVLMLDGDGRPVFCNAAARSMACHHLFSWRPDGRLGMTTSGDERRLQEALRELAKREVGSPMWTSVHNSHGELVATLKLCSTPPTDSAEPPVRTLAFIKLLEPLCAPALVPGLKAQWGLTSAEAQLAQQLMNGRSLDEAARRISVTKNTVRTQLRSLFMKTDTHRQAELVRVLLKLSQV